MGRHPRIGSGMMYFSIDEEIFRLMYNELQFDSGVGVASGFQDLIGCRLLL